jgi:hypothetical protein
LTQHRRATALFAALFVAALVATGLVVTSRSPDLVLEVTALPAKFYPHGGGEPDEAAITFFVRESDPAAQVSIVGRDLRQTRTLDEAVGLTANLPVTYTWDGRMDSGQLAPPGRYRLRVVLPGEERDMVFPKRLRLASG